MRNAGYKITDSDGTKNKIEIKSNKKRNIRTQQQDSTLKLNQITRT